MIDDRDTHAHQSDDDSTSRSQTDQAQGQARSEKSDRREKGGDSSKYPSQWADTPLKDVIDRFFDDRVWMEPFDFLRTHRMLSRFDRAFFPRMDITETDSEVKVVADVPGVDPDDIHISVRGNRLRLSSEIDRKVESPKGERPYRYERTYGAFRREIVLPAYVKDEEVTAVCKNGILTITLPKVEEERRKKITIEKQ